MSAEPASTTPTAEALRALLRKIVRRGERIFAVIDAARAYELATAARERSDRTRWHGTLMAGPLARYLEHVAPHLVEIDPKTDFLEAWADHLGRSAGTLWISEASAEQMRAHLRKLFVVSDEAGTEYSFRFYDPRVLRAFLPTCRDEQAPELFGPARLLLVEADARALLVCSVAGAHVRIEPAQLLVAETS